MSNIYCWLNTDNAKEVTRTASYELNNKKHKEIKSDL